MLHACYFVSQSGCEKIIVDIMDSDHGMRDTVVRVTDPWEAESDGERGSIPTTWKLGPMAWGGTLPSADIEAKLKLAAINYDHRNWSWLLDRNIPPLPPAIPRASTLAKSQLTVDLKRPRVPGRVILAKKKRAPAQPSQTQLLEEVAHVYS